MINAAEVLHAQFVHSLGLDRYAELMRGNPSSPDYQRLFNGYYRIRRDEDWRRHYYSLFDQAREQHYSFEQIVSELYRLTGNVEASFSSKILATIDASKPIWDQYVLQNLGLKLTGKTQEERVRNAVSLYAQIEKWYAEYLVTAEARKNIEEFNCLFPEYAWISDTKKIDFLLWGKRG